MPGLDDGGLRLDGGEGGGFWSKADGDALIENTTISNNKAAIGGGGLFHDADGELSSPTSRSGATRRRSGGGIGVVESDFAPEVPPKANESVILRNTIVGGSLEGGSCDWYVTSEGGNLTGGSVPCVRRRAWSRPTSPLPPIHGCFVTRRRARATRASRASATASATRDLDAIADNGGPTLTHARPARAASPSTTASLPCPETDQRGVARPQNGKCDAGAFEYVGPAAGRRRRCRRTPST